MLLCVNRCISNLVFTVLDKAESVVIFSRYLSVSFQALNHLLAVAGDCVMLKAASVLLQYVDHDLKALYIYSFF